MTNAEYNAGYLSLGAIERAGDVGLLWATGGPVLAHYGLRAAILRRWPGVAAPAPRPAPAVGFAWGANQVSEHEEVDHPDGIWWYAVDRVNAFGLLTHGRDVAPRVFIGGQDIGPLPSSPSGLTRAQVGNAVRLAWMYEPIGQQVAPERFDVFGDGGTGTMDWVTVVASVVYGHGRRQYAWLSDAKNDGDVAQYSVRARSAAGVYSLIPAVQDLHTGASALYGEGSGLRQLMRIGPLTAPEVVT
ncbi:MAG: hypothetical protein LC135_01785 [Phycisphaerae bacterium]|nr:hypothetical protein [Phycisphaerae bacterium]MCZ2398584.1 hypothetical protein [Phycisphaerae bacterium]